MIVGNQERFAIEVEIEERLGDFVLGHIRFWICGNAVGDWEDSADLLGCLRWLEDFCSKPRNRYEPGVWKLPAVDVFRLLYDHPMARENRLGDLHVTDAFGRFNISYLGMSSFDRFDVLLLSDESGRQRCLWREASSDVIHDCYLDRREIESVAEEFCEKFERLIRDSYPA